MGRESLAQAKNAPVGTAPQISPFIGQQAINDIVGQTILRTQVQEIPGLFVQTI